MGRPKRKQHCPLEVHTKDIPRDFVRGRTNQPQHESSSSPSSSSIQCERQAKKRNRNTFEHRHHHHHFGTKTCTDAKQITKNSQLHPILSNNFVEYYDPTTRSDVSFEGEDYSETTSDDLVNGAVSSNDSNGDRNNDNDNDNNVLSESDIQKFIEDGYVILSNAFDKQLANYGREQMWWHLKEKYNILKENPNSWIVERQGIPHCFGNDNSNTILPSTKSKLKSNESTDWNTILQSKRLISAINQLCGGTSIDTWVPFGLGWWTINFPGFHHHTKHQHQHQTQQQQHEEESNMTETRITATTKNTNSPPSSMTAVFDTRNNQTSSCANCKQKKKNITDWNIASGRWHIDGSHYRHYINSKESGLVLLFLFSDILHESHGGTAMCVGSHTVSSQVLYEVGSDGISNTNLSRTVLHRIKEVLKKSCSTTSQFKLQVQLVMLCCVILCCYTHVVRIVHPMETMLTMFDSYVIQISNYVTVNESSIKKFPKIIKILLVMSTIKRKISTSTKLIQTLTMQKIVVPHTIALLNKLSLMQFNNYCVKRVFYFFVFISRTLFGGISC